MKTMSRKTVAVLLFLVVAVISLSSCSSKLFSKPAVIYGTWVLVNEKGENGPITVTFNEDGIYRYGYDTKLQSDPGPVSDAVNTFINSSVLKDIASETGLTSLLKSESAQKFLSEISKAAELKYKIIDDSTMETKVSLLFGFLDHTSEVSYSLNGDELVFDGVQYRRVTED